MAEDPIEWIRRDYWAAGPARGETPEIALTAEEHAGVRVAAETMRLLAKQLSPTAAAQYEPVITSITDPARTWTSYRQADERLMRLGLAIDWDAETQPDAVHLGHAVDDARWFIRALHIRGGRRDSVFPTSSGWLVDDLSSGGADLPTDLLGFWKLMAAGVDLDVALDLVDIATLPNAGQL